MAKRPAKPGPAKVGKDPHAIIHTRAKASKPKLKPLDEHLAALLNPALAKGEAKPEGFTEAPQARFDPGEGDEAAQDLSKLVRAPGAASPRSPWPW